mmetsp:Transcript_34083/g.90863  ORF Transcript_34083/g.90863 Transcript_34083/m.90863 type:complete len:203 (-) Transcript_34083:1064-1672(-)
MTCGVFPITGSTLFWYKPLGLLGSLYVLNEGASRRGSSACLCSAACQTRWTGSRGCAFPSIVPVSTLFGRSYRDDGGLSPAAKKLRDCESLGPDAPCKNASTLSQVSAVTSKRGVSDVTASLVAVSLRNAALPARTSPLRCTRRVSKVRPRGGEEMKASLSLSSSRQDGLDVLRTSTCAKSASKSSCGSRVRCLHVCPRYLA